MSMKHTPGPWKAYCRDVGHKKGSPWPEDQFLQWEVSGPRVPHGRGEYYEADARLIASAPDMLAALLLITQADPCIAKTTDEELRAAMEDEGEEQEVRAQARAFLGARAAIAKATGGQA